MEKENLSHTPAPFSNPNRDYCTRKVIPAYKCKVKPKLAQKGHFKGYDSRTTPKPMPFSQCFKCKVNDRSIPNAKKVKSSHLS